MVLRAGLRIGGGPASVSASGGAAPSLAALQSFRAAGSYYPMLGVDYSIPATIAFGLGFNFYMCVPFISGRGLVVDRLGYERVQAGPTERKARLGIYTSLPGTLYPGQLLGETGVLTNTAPAFVQGVVSIRLAAASLYWLTLVVSASHQLRCVSALNLSAVLGFPIGTPLGGSGVNFGWNINAYDSNNIDTTPLAATMPAGGASGDAQYPLLLVRVA